MSQTTTIPYLKRKNLLSASIKTSLKSLVKLPSTFLTWALLLSPRTLLAAAALVAVAPAQVLAARPAQLIKAASLEAVFFLHLST